MSDQGSCKREFGVPIGPLTSPSESSLTSVGHKWGSRNIDTNMLSTCCYGWSCHSPRCDCMNFWVTEVQHQSGHQGDWYSTLVISGLSRWTREDVVYIFTKVDTTPFKMGAASCTQEIQKHGNGGRICELTRNIKILARFAAVMTLSYACENRTIVFMDIRTQNRGRL